MGAKPIAVVPTSDGWDIVEAGTGEHLDYESTKQAAINQAKEWVIGDAEWTGGYTPYSHLVIHKSNGSVQRGWWPPSNRIIRVQPLGTDLESQYPDVVKDFEQQGHQRPYWRVEKKKDGRWNLYSIEPTQREAVDNAVEQWKRDWTRRLSVYGSDWYKEDEYVHEV